MNTLRSFLFAFLDWISTSLAAVQEPIWVVLHKIPDKDAIVSAITVATLKLAMGFPAIAKAQGKPNPETEYLLKRFGSAAPMVTFVFKKHSVILVGHADYDLGASESRSRSMRLGSLKKRLPIIRSIRGV